MTNRLYCRTSTLDQFQDRQLFILKEKGYDESNSIIYEEKVSGKSTKNRNELRRLLNDLDKGDIVVCSEISRLARSTIDLWEIANEILKKDCTLICIKENFDLSTAMGRFTFNIFGSIAQLERETISERTKDGLAAKKKSGIRLGRPTVIDKETIDNAVKTYINNKISYEKVGKLFGISGVTVYNEVKKYKNKGE